MQWIILIGNEDLSLESVKSIEHNNSIQKYDVDETRYCIEFGDDHIFYDSITSAELGYEEDVLIKLKNLPIKTLHFIMMTYTSEERMKKILIQKDFFRGIYVDNGHRLIVPIEEFIKLGMPVK